jgi:hypothetical protein
MPRQCDGWYKKWPWKDDWLNNSAISTAFVCFVNWSDCKSWSSDHLLKQGICAELVLITLMYIFNVWWEKLYWYLSLFSKHKKKGKTRCMFHVSLFGKMTKMLAMCLSFEQLFHHMTKIVQAGFSFLFSVHGRVWLFSLFTRICRCALGQLIEYQKIEPLHYLEHWCLRQD